jgi:predicted GH43/DUF377 family glycosyl hydrolase
VEGAAGFCDAVGRYSRNPIIPRDAIPTSSSVFNSAVVTFNGSFAGVFQCDDKKCELNLHAGNSQDAIHWTIEPQPIQFICDDPKVSRFQYRYDLRSAPARRRSRQPRAGCSLIREPSRLSCSRVRHSQMRRTGPIVTYYGAADTVTGLAFGYIGEILAYLKDNSEV